MPFDLSEMSEEPSGIDPNMDPGFQKLIMQREFGMAKSATASSDENETAVIALVTKFELWESNENVKKPVFIGSEEDGDLVTGRIPLAKIEEILALPEVLEIEPSKPIFPTLRVSISETEASSNQLPPDTLSNGGEGVLIGVVDFGFDLSHPNFRNADGTTRVTEIWDQLGQYGLSAPYGYGQAYKEVDINQALRTENVFATLGYDLFKGSNPAYGTHGTHVADIAAGNGQGTGTPGFAPKAELMFVAATAPMPAGITEAGKGMGESDNIIDAVRYIFERSNGRPTVVNLSLGTHAGPHDGKGLIERSIDTLVDAEPNRAVVIAAGNSYMEDSHQSGRLEPGTYVDVEWGVPHDVPPQIVTEVQTWYPKDAKVRVELYAPGGQFLGGADPADGRRCVIGYALGAYLSNRTNQDRGRDNVISTQLYPGMPGGIYRIRLVLLSDEAIDFHSWIERCPFVTKFRPPTDQSMTLGSLSSGRLTLTVGAYDATVPGTPLSVFSSSGPTRDGRKKPEVSAPGEKVLAAHAGIPNRSIGQSGTSMAAPAVTGIIALVFAEAKALGKDLSVHEVRDIIIKAARKNPPGGDWDPRYGYGRISAQAALEQVKALAKEMEPF